MRRRDERRERKRRRPRFWRWSCWDSVSAVPRPNARSQPRGHVPDQAAGHVAGDDARRTVPQPVLHVLLGRGARAAGPGVRPVARRPLQIAEVLVQRATGDPVQAAQVVQLRGQGGRVQVVCGQGDDGNHHFWCPGPRHGRVRQYVPVPEQKHTVIVSAIV